MTQVETGITELNGTSPAPASGPASRDFLVFRIGAAEYGMEISKVQEIRGYGPVTAVAHAPACVKGTIDLRGTSVPIIDARVKFDLARAECDPFAIVIVSSDTGRAVGIAVDSVSEVLCLQADHIRGVPEYGAATDLRCFDAIGTVNGRSLILVNLDRLTADADLGHDEPSVH